MWSQKISTFSHLLNLSHLSHKIVSIVPISLNLARNQDPELRGLCFWERGELVKTKSLHFTACKLLSDCWCGCFQHHAFRMNPKWSSPTMILLVLLMKFKQVSGSRLRTSKRPEADRYYTTWLLWFEPDSNWMKIKTLFSKLHGKL